MAGQPVMTFGIARDVGAYEERPVVAGDTDPQLHISRNDRAQPFWLICEKDTVVVQMSGDARLAFSEGPIRFFDLVPGDFVYVPGGAPHHISPATESVQYRYKAREAGLEGVAWFCGFCGVEVARRTWDTAEILPQEGYVQACVWFDSFADHRTCGSCGDIHPQTDAPTDIWSAAAHALRTAKEA